MATPVRIPALEAEHVPAAGLRRFALLSLFGATCAAAGGLYAVTGRGTPCPFLMATGWLCPICGASRMGAALLRGEPLAAWSANPFVLVLGILLALVWGWTGLRLLSGRSVALPTPLGRWLERGGPGHAMLRILLPAAAWLLVRNLL